jgi:hypothetical protein
MTDQTTPPAETPKAEKTRRVLILNDTTIDGVPYKCRSVVDLPTQTADTLVAGSVADDNKAAWEQALKADKAKPVKHVPVATSVDADD